MIDGKLTRIEMEPRSTGGGILIYCYLVKIGDLVVNEYLNEAAAKQFAETLNAAFEKTVDFVASEENAACAKIAEDKGDKDIAKAIRARAKSKN